MNLLALDTSTPRAALALAVEGSPARVAPVDAGVDRRHGRGLIPDIRALLDAGGMTFRDLGAVAVGVGPGSYTGLRIGLMAAKAFAYAGSIPLVGLDSLEAIARTGGGDALRVSVVVDAQRGDVYVGEFARPDASTSLRPLGPTRIEPFAPWAAALEPETLVLGPALDRLPSAWPEGVRLGTVDQGHPGGAALVELAREALADGRVADPYLLEPVYLRRSAAEDQWDARLSLTRTPPGGQSPS